MIGWNGIESNLLDAVDGVKSLAVLAGLLGVVFFAPNIWQWKFRPNFPMAVGVSMLLVVCVLRFDANSPFLYFQF